MKNIKISIKVNLAKLSRIIDRTPQNTNSMKTSNAEQFNLLCVGFAIHEKQYSKILEELPEDDFENN
jgi:hypothetical protein